MVVPLRGFGKVICDSFRKIFFEGAEKRKLIASLCNCVVGGDSEDVVNLTELSCPNITNLRTRKDTPSCLFPIRHREVRCALKTVHLLQYWYVTVPKR